MAESKAVRDRPFIFGVEAAMKPAPVRNGDLLLYNCNDVWQRSVQGGRISVFS